MFQQLPAKEQARAREAYRLWRLDPRHNSLQFKRVSRVEPVYSVRVGLRNRALGLLEDDVVTWFWIGSHSDYDRLLG
jgi:hypothetical protein